MNPTHEQARRLHTHKIVFDAGDDVECAIRALLGQSTEAIMLATGLSAGQVQYRISKAQINRWDFRHGRTQLASEMIARLHPHATAVVRRDIAPKFSGLKDR